MFEEDVIMCHCSCQRWLKSKLNMLKGAFVDWIENNQILFYIKQKLLNNTYVCQILIEINKG